VKPWLAERCFPDLRLGIPPRLLYEYNSKKRAFSVILYYNTYNMIEKEKKAAAENLMPVHAHNDINPSKRMENLDGLDPSPFENEPTEMMVGVKIRELRNQRGLSLRALAERSGLNINTLSLIENGKCSPSVGTLQLLAKALEVPITAFFESEPVSKRVVFTGRNRRPEATFSQARMQNLGKDLADNAVQPFVVTLEPGAGSGERTIVHTGHEFVYCLSGKILYVIDKIDYSLEPGDSVVFEAHLPHQWKNMDERQSQIILIVFPADQRDEPGGRHFTNINH
jgi:transcriptional regulator with XRE-family HTH domain